MGAFPEISAVLGTGDTDILVVGGNRQAFARLQVCNNSGGNRTYTVKHYKAATATTVVLRNAWNVNTLSSADLPPISLNEGDKIIASVSAGVGEVIITGGVTDNSKVIFLGLPGLDGTDPGYPFVFNDKTDVEEPDYEGEVNFDNGTLADVTKIIISAKTAGALNPDISDVIESWDDWGSPDNRGRLLLKNRVLDSQYVEYRVVGDVTFHDDTIDWYEVPVEYIGGPGVATLANLSVQFYDAGQAGAAGIDGASALTVVDVIDTAGGDPDTDYEDGDTLNGVTLVTAMIVLRVAASDPEANGPYVVPVSGAASRHPSFTTFDEHVGREFNVVAGTAHASTKWRCTSGYGGTIDVDPLTFVQVGPNATDTVQGIVELATTTEAQAGTDNGRAVTPLALRAATRRKLLANLTLYVRTDGNDSNPGEADNSGGALLTIAKAMEIAAGLDAGPYDVTVQVRSGTRTSPVVLPRMLGTGTHSVIGDTGTPSNCVISTTSADAIKGTDAGRWTVQGFKLQTTTSGIGLVSSGRTYIRYSAIDFGACAGFYQAHGVDGGSLEVIGSYSISGSATFAHITAEGSGSNINAGFGRTITVSANLSYGIGFAYAIGNAFIKTYNNTYSLGANTVTGKRGRAEGGGVIQLNGSHTVSTCFAGNANADTGSGGQII